MDASSKLKGTIAESICKIHFMELGYKVEHNGVENTLPYFTSMYKKFGLQKIIQKMPDFVATKDNISMLIEVKYRTNPNLKLLNRELIWTYRDLIFTNIDKSNFSDDIVKNWYVNDDYYRSPNNLVDEMFKIKKNKKDKKPSINHIIFYLVQNKEPYIQISSSIDFKWYDTSKEEVEKKYNRYSGISKISNEIIIPTMLNMFR